MGGVVRTGVRVDSAGAFFIDWAAPAGLELHPLVQDSFADSYDSPFEKHNMRSVRFYKKLKLGIEIRMCWSFLILRVFWQRPDSWDIL